MTPLVALFGAIIFAAYGVQTATGFGAGIVAVTLGAQLMDIREILLYLLPLSLLQCGYVASRNRAAIDWPLLGRWIIPVMGGGTVAGAVLASDIGGDTLRRVLAALILVLSLYELAALSRKDLVRRPIGAAGTFGGLVGAGLMHGIYGCGGPLLSYTVGRRGLDKASFRSTITVVWILLNIFLIAYFFADGRYRSEHATGIALLVPFVVAGVAAGELAFRRLGGRRFNQIIFALLALAALSLLIR